MNGSPDAGILVAAGDFFFRFRNGLFPVVMGALLLVARPTKALDESDAWLWSAAGIAILGELVRLGTIGYRYIDRGGKDGRVYASWLVTGGIFGHVRNPMYVGNLLMIVGIAMYSGSVALLLVAVPFFLFVWRAITAAEERFLRGKFGEEYTAYCRAVNRFVPRLAGLSATLSSMHFEWKRSLRKDYGNMLTVALALILLPVWRNGHLDGWDTLDDDFALAGVQLAVAVPAYLVLRVLKKRGRLADDVPAEARVSAT